MMTYDPFWDTLKKKKISTYALIKYHAVSSSLIHRMRHNLPITTVTLNDFFRILDCKVEDIVLYKNDPDESPQ